MTLTHEEYAALKNDLLQEFKNVFVEAEECNDKQKEINGKLANDDTRIKLFEQKITQWEWLFKLIATGTIGTLVTSVLALILK